MKYWLIDNDPDLRFENPNEVAAELIPDDMYEENYESFDEWIDENDGPVSICGYEYSASTVLSEMDHDAYQNEFDRWCEDRVEADREDAVWSLNHTEHGDYTWVNDTRVYAYDEEEEVGDTDGDNELSADDLKTVEENFQRQQKQQEEEETASIDDFMSLIQTIG